MTLGSLFSGIGGLDLGLERAGFEVRWQVESNPWCRKVLAKHWPTVERYERIQDVSVANLARVDCIAGGFPCQDISNAGAREGIDGKRSGLWREFARLVRELRPSIVIVENVSALLARGLGRVLGDLAACGYDAQWDCIPASAVGAPHRRDRIFIIAHAVGDELRLEPGRQRGEDGPGEAQPREHGEASDVADPSSERSRGLPVRPRRPQQEGPDAIWGGEDVADPTGEGRGPEAGRSFTGAGREALRGGPEESGRGSGDVPDAEGSRRSEGLDAWPERAGWPRPSGSGWWDTEPDVGRVAHGVPRRVDRLRGLGNAVVPQVAEWIGKLALR